LKIIMVMGGILGVIAAYLIIRFILWIKGGSIKKWSKYA
jgi:hypothetical protein